MTRREKLNWAIAIVGLIASILSILAFLTGANSLPSMMKKPEPKPPALTNPTMMGAPVVEKKKASPGDVVTAPARNFVNWTAGRLKVRHSANSSNSATKPAD